MGFDMEVEEYIEDPLVEKMLLESKNTNYYVLDVQNKQIVVRTTKVALPTV